MTLRRLVIGGVLLAALPAFAQDAPTGDVKAGDVKAGDVKAGDVKAGRRVAAGICQACHGLDGLAKVPEVPNLAGMDAAYVTKQLRAFKAGTRQNETMQAVVGTLTDQKMADVAAYFAAIEVTVGKVPGP